MAHRMLGRLTGTAGSGYDYLDETAKRYTPFRDLFDVATYLLPRARRCPACRTRSRATSTSACPERAGASNRTRPR